MFEGYGTAPPARLRAILTYGQERQRYVYFPKPPVLEERWSEWQSADFQSEDYGFSQKLLYSGKYESQPASDNATKVRFRLKSFNQQRQDLDDYRKGIGREEIPPC
ncbi:MAG: hypothetical protein H6R10_1953 [Rhodocyclaceae bacterium]|nr:hypothetical protein [Rhodocyclaceae bacterium]